MGLLLGWLRCVASKVSEGTRRCLPLTTSYTEAGSLRHLTLFWHPIKQYGSSQQQISLPLSARIAHNSRPASK